ncbi:hypothetical protein BGZ61DRAFT_406380 [Ilyonectria robusta]|uniref:uncharacterized protein n=1 Tax=Ilyonectria robusta TaxID=1079257 RepID=UPI001E8CBD0D|nr:uncharacterized protein BGZ61DRAFT_406380 [Ilyonectria robusta]KAH8650780.1 hypothetical protein BGZ61DRAFT_406380 [Ilyonectria robusta]
MTLSMYGITPQALFTGAYSRHLRMWLRPPSTFGALATYGSLSDEVPRETPEQPVTLFVSVEPDLTPWDRGQAIVMKCHEVLQVGS